MLNNFQASLQYVLQSEGGFVDNPNDVGGATMKGITLDTYKIYKKNTHLTPNDLKLISDMDVSTIYLNQYWNACRCSDLPSGIDYCVFDASVNMGYSRATKILQESCGATPDGTLGSITMALIRQSDRNLLIKTFSEKKEAFYRRIVANNPSQSIFLKGWLARIESVKNNAVTIMLA